MCEIVKIGDASAFVCGHQNHKCNSDGSVLLLSNGYEVPDTAENVEKYKDQIRGGSVACSICGKSAYSNSRFE